MLNSSIQVAVSLLVLLLVFPDKLPKQAHEELTK